MGKTINRKQSALVAGGMDSAEAWMSVGKTDRAAAEVTREKYDYYRDMISPVEDQVLGNLFSPEEMTRQVMQSRGYVASGFEAGRNATTDMRERYGDGRTAEETAFEKRRSELRQALAETGTADQVRGMAFERDINTATGLTRLGRGMSSSATAGLTSAAASEAQRDAYNQQQESAQKSGQVGMAVGGAATGAYLGATYGMAGGPIGMAVGAVVGGVAGYVAGS
jgi:hypothetical protein